jgi:WD40 repeat protein
VGHERTFSDMPDGERIQDRRGPSISYFPDGQQMISGCRGKTSRRWDLQAGEEIEEARVVCEQGVNVGIFWNTQLNSTRVSLMVHGIYTQIPTVVYLIVEFVSTVDRNRLDVLVFPQ